MLVPPDAVGDKTEGFAMNQLDQSQMEMHVKIVGWLHIIGSSVFLMVGLLLLLLLPGIGIASGDDVARRVLSVVGPVMFVFLTVIAIPGLAAGYGLLKRRSWSRVLAIVVGIINLMNVPVGTMIGAYTCFVLLQETSGDYFAQVKVA